MLSVDGSLQYISPIGANGKCNFDYARGSLYLDQIVTNTCAWTPYWVINRECLQKWWLQKIPLIPILNWAFLYGKLAKVTHVPNRRLLKFSAPIFCLCERSSWSQYATVKSGSKSSTWQQQQHATIKMTDYSF